MIDEEALSYVLLGKIDLNDIDDPGLREACKLAAETLDSVLRKLPKGA